MVLLPVLCAEDVIFVKAFEEVESSETGGMVLRRELADLEESIASMTSSGGLHEKKKLVLISIPLILNGFHQFQEGAFQVSTSSALC